MAKRRTTSGAGAAGTDSPAAGPLLDRLVASAVRSYAESHLTPARLARSVDAACGTATRLAGLLGPSAADAAAAVLSQLDRGAAAKWLSKELLSVVRSFATHSA